MEVAGLVLGGIPLLFYAFDNYKRCLKPGKDYWRYDSTLRTIRSHMFVQQEQLDITLRNIGLEKPTRAELERHLNSIYSQSKCAEVMAVINNMQTTVCKAMNSLDIDMKGKPQWTSDSEERVSWEWRRIRRSFSRCNREQLVADLQYWNTALKNILEKPEIPLAEATPCVQDIRMKFDQKYLDAARREYQRMHEMLSKKWNCGCEEHKGNIRLHWHAFDVPRAHSLLLTLPSNSSSQWHHISMNFQAADTSGDWQLADTARENLAHTNPRSPSSFQAQRLKSLFSPKEESTSSSASLTIPTTPPLPLQTSVGQKQEIQCLCDYLKRAKQIPSGYIGDPEANHKRLLIDFIPSISQYTEIAPLPSVLGVSKLNQQSHPQILLSRKQRFSIAAAAAWAILYLYGSPWMGTDWGGKSQIQLFIEGNGATRRLAEHPTLVYIFKSTLEQDLGSRSDSPSGIEGFQSNQIRNKELFALGILLIELCLDKSFEEIRRESRGSSRPLVPLDISSSVVDDFEIANSQTDRIYLEAGDSYGYAVQRCLRCEFPGRDVTKTFDFSQFRQSFFNGVVAPIQATYMMLPCSVAEM